MSERHSSDAGQKLPKTERDKYTGNDCSICLLNDPPINMLSLCCGTGVHIHCLVSWLNTRKSLTCPTCRTPIHFPPITTVPEPPNPLSNGPPIDISDVNNISSFLQSLFYRSPDEFSEESEYQHEEHEDLCSYCSRKRAHDCPHDCCGICCRQMFMSCPRHSDTDIPPPLIPYNSIDNHMRPPSPRQSRAIYSNNITATYQQRSQEPRPAPHSDQCRNCNRLSAMQCPNGCCRRCCRDMRNTSDYTFCVRHEQVFY